MKTKILFLFILLSIILVACASPSANAGASQAVENYLTALAAKEQAPLITNVCADWEDDALIELDSFALLELTLDNMACTESGNDGNTTLVNCTGTMQMSYNGEPQQLDLSTRTYEVINQNGEWLICGTR